MKTKNLKIKKIYSFNKIYFLKNNINKNNYKNNLYLINSKLKTIIKTIHTYNSNNKQIWFLGFLSPKTYKTKHVFLSRYNYIKGLISNKKFVRLIINNNKKINTINLTKPNLVIIYCLNENTIPLLKELNKYNIPVIVVGSTILNYNCTTYISINQNLKELHSLFSFIVHAVLKTK